jgi:hypothetical protein
LVGAFGTLSQLILYLIIAALKIIDLLSCNVIVPLYTGTVYDGMCTYAPGAVYWTFACAVVMAVSGMGMITMRASYKPTVYEQEPARDENGAMSDDDVFIKEIAPITTAAETLPNESNGKAAAQDPDSVDHYAIVNNNKDNDSDTDSDHHLHDYYADERGVLHERQYSAAQPQWADFGVRQQQHPSREYTYADDTVGI